MGLTFGIDHSLQSNMTSLNLLQLYQLFDDFWFNLIIGMENKNWAVLAEARACSRQRGHQRYLLSGWHPNS